MTHLHTVERPDRVLQSLQAVGVSDDETMAWLIHDLVRRGEWSHVHDIAQAHLDLEGS